MGLANMNTLLTAIVDDELIKVTKLLSDDPGLAVGGIAAEKLYRARIFHWIYVGDTALHLAAAGYRVEIIKSLLVAGADPNAAANRRHSRPLHYASDGFLLGPEYSPASQVETLKLLLAGAAINAQDQNGATALHRAVRTRCAAAAMYLLSAGADRPSATSPDRPLFTWLSKTRDEAVQAKRWRKTDNGKLSRGSCHSALAPISETVNAKQFSIVPGARGYEVCLNSERRALEPIGMRNAESHAYLRRSDLCVGFADSVTTVRLSNTVIMVSQTAEANNTRHSRFSNVVKHCPTFTVNTHSGAVLLGPSQVRF